MGIADQTVELGEVDETGRAPSVLELIFRRADRRTADKNKRINIPNNTPGIGR
jgi:DNA-binding transcriptional regulator/RsmH inhibitor MraZ